MLAPPPEAPLPVQPVWRQSWFAALRLFHMYCGPARAVTGGPAHGCNEGRRGGVINRELFAASRVQAPLGAVVTRGDDHGLALGRSLLEEDFLGLVVRTTHACVRLARTP